MDAPGRSRILIGLMLLICLALVGSWILLRDVAPQTPPPLAATPAAVDVRTSDPTPEVIPPPRTDHALRGRVYDAASGKGIAAAHVVGGFQSTWPTGTTVSTKEDGSFVIDRAPPGHALLEVSASGYAARQLRIVITDDTAPLQIALSAGRAISGAVTGIQPKELSRVAVIVSRDDEPDSSLHSLLDSAGNYVIRGVRPGDVQLTAQFGARRISKAVTMPADTDIRVDVDFPPGARLSGRTLSRGRPMPGVRIKARLATGPSSYVVETSSSAGGEYAFESLDMGEYVISAGGRSSEPLQIWGDTVLNLEVSAAQVSGSVREAAGEMPIVHASVYVWSAEGPYLQGFSDDRGRFQLTVHTQGDLTVTIYKPGYALFRERISDGTPIGAMNVRLQRDAGVQITVSEAGTRKPLRQVSVVEGRGIKSGVMLTLQLDENGVGYLPRALTGNTLTFMTAPYKPVNVRDWDGESIELELVPQ